MILIFKALNKYHKYNLNFLATAAHNFKWVKTTHICLVWDHTRDIDYERKELTKIMIILYWINLFGLHGSHTLFCGHYKVKWPSQKVKLFCMFNWHLNVVSVVAIIVW